MLKKIMIYSFLVGNLFFITNVRSMQESERLDKIDKYYEQLKLGEKLVETEVENDKTQKTQSLKFYIFGLHPKKCQMALRKLSLYESYKDFIEFVKESRFDEKTQRLYFKFDSPLLPIPLSLSFKLPRIDKVGVYPFSFDQGFLKNLKGNIYIEEKNDRCLFSTTASWQGPDTGFSNLVLEVFSTTLSRLAMEKLFRISSL